MTSLSLNQRVSSSQSFSFPCHKATYCSNRELQPLLPLDSVYLVSQAKQILQQAPADSVSPMNLSASRLTRPKPSNLERT